MPQSFFNYNITRPYPYRWFTWLVVLGGIAAAAIFSVINLAANGVITTTNPNDTELPAQPSWFQRKPWSQAAKVSAKCREQTLVVGSQFYTTNFGFPYKLKALYRNGTEPRASCVYHNDYLHGCRIIRMEIKLSDSLNRNNLAQLDTWTTIECTVYEESVPVAMVLDLPLAMVNMTGMESGLNMPIFLSKSNETQPSLFVGARLAVIYQYLFWLQLRRYGQLKPYYRYRLTSLTEQVSRELPPDPGPVAYVHLFMPEVLVASLAEPNMPGPGPVRSDVWMAAFGMDLLSRDWMATINMQEGSRSTRNLSDPLVNVFLSLDGLARLLCFTILSDLGQATDINALASPQKTMELWNKTLQMYHIYREEPSGLPERCTTLGTPSSLAEFYRCVQVAMPIVRPITIWMQYTCQIPKLKSIGSLIISIIVADLVFLQVLWKLLNWITTFIVERRDPDAKSCCGCAKQAVDGKDLDQELIVPEEKSNTDGASVRGSIAFSSSRNHEPYQPLPQVISRSSSLMRACTSPFTAADPSTPHNESESMVELLKKQP